MNDGTTLNRKYLVYSIDVDPAGNQSTEREPEIQSFGEITTWLVDDDIKLRPLMSALLTMEPGENCVSVEGQHGNFESREIHFIKLKD